MCAVTAIPYIIMAAGALASSQGAKEGAAAQKNALDFQAGEKRNEAQLAEYAAKDAIERGQQAQFRSRLNAGQLKGAQRARLAAAGLDLTEGSALNILLDTEMFSDMDAATISDNAEREAWALRENAKGNRRNAHFLAFGASQISPSQAGFTSLLGSAGSVASSWYGYNRAGGGSSGGAG
jgi:hypothetical protein